MYLGLDLRGGVHFLMQVDMKAALTKKAESLTGDVRSMLREKNIRHSGINRDGNTVLSKSRSATPSSAPPAIEGAEEPAARQHLDAAGRRQRAAS